MSWLVIVRASVLSCFECHSHAEVIDRVAPNTEAKRRQISQADLAIGNGRTVLLVPHDWSHGRVQEWLLRYLESPRSEIPLEVVA